MSFTIASVFTIVGSALDSGVTAFCRELGSQVKIVCPGCKAMLAAPIGAKVRCSACSTEFTVDSAGQKAFEIFSETAKSVKIAFKDLTKINPPDIATDIPITEPVSQENTPTTITRKPLNRNS